jgi:hypothetical protein
MAMSSSENGREEPSGRETSFDDGLPAPANRMELKKPRLLANPYAPWVMLAILAFAVRAAVAIVHPPAFDGDQQLYLDLARSLAQGTGYVTGGEPQTHVSPLVPLLGSFVVRWVPDERWGFMIALLLVASALPALAGFTVSLVLGRTAGILAGVAVLLAPHLVLRSGYLEPDMTTAVFYFWATSLLLRRQPVLAGFALGAAALCRPEAVFLIVPFALVLVMARTPALTLALSLTTYLAVASVFPVYLRGATGHWGLTGKAAWVYALGVHQYRTHDAPLPPADIAALLTDVGSPVDHVRREPKEAFSGYLARTKLLARHVARTVPMWLAPLVLLGAGTMARAGGRLRFAMFAFPLTLFAVLPVGVVFFRHTLTLAPFLLALAGAGVAAAINWLGGAWRERTDRMRPASLR